MNLILRQNLGGPTFATNIVLSGNPPSEPVLDSQFVDIFWRFEDEPDMEPLFLGRGNAGETFQTAFDPKGRPIRLFAASATEDGQRLITDYSKMVQTVFEKDLSPEDEGATILAGETMIAPCLVNIYDDSGTATARYAHATSQATQADGFIVTSVESGNGVTVYFGGSKMTGLTGLTLGAQYFLSTTNGAITTTAPTGSGNIQQQVGEAISESTLQFEPQMTIKKR